MSRALIAVLVLWFATSLLGCGEAETRALQPAPDPSPPVVAEPWHYAPALRAGTPADVAAAPVFELADGHTGVAQIAVAVARAGAPPRLELWEFDQNNPRERLERVGEAKELVALDGSGGREQLEAIRKAIARPGNEFVRPRGISSPPEELLHELVRLAGVVRDEAAAPKFRAEALAKLTFALDDRLLFERNSLPPLLAALASGDWRVAEQKAVGERRREVVVRAPRHRFELARAGERWMLSEASLVEEAVPVQSSEPAAPAAEPSPTAP